MNPKSYLFPLIAVLVGLAFATICLVLYFRSNNKKLIHAKLKVGAFLLSFSSIVSCGTTQPTCYDVAPANNSIVLELGNDIYTGDTISGHFYQPTFSNYSVVVKSISDTLVLQSTLVLPVDDSITTNKPRFYFILDSSIQPGRYVGSVYGEKGQQVLKSELIELFNFTVKPRP